MAARRTIAFRSILRIHSREDASRPPISLSVRGASPDNPKRRPMTSRSRGPRRSRRRISSRRSSPRSTSASGLGFGSGTSPSRRRCPIVRVAPIDVEA